MKAGYRHAHGSEARRRLQTERRAERTRDRLVDQQRKQQRPVVRR